MWQAFYKGNWATLQRKELQFCTNILGYNNILVPFIGKYTTYGTKPPIFPIRYISQYMAIGNAWVILRLLHGLIQLLPMSRRRLFSSHPTSLLENPLACE